MNLDLLIKLVKLANNNPNENEANLAARKVCKMIAEGNYKFTTDSVQPKVKITSNPVNTDFDWIRKQYEDMMNNRPKYNPTEKQRQYYGYDYDWGKDPYDSGRKSVSKPCTKCGHVFQTFDVKVPYVCFACERL